MSLDLYVCRAFQNVDINFVVKPHFTNHIPTSSIHVNNPKLENNINNSSRVILILLVSLIPYKFSWFIVVNNMLLSFILWYQMMHLIWRTMNNLPELFKKVWTLNPLHVKMDIFTNLYHLYWLIICYFFYFVVSDNGSHLEEEDEQLARALQESLNTNSPPRENGHLYEPITFPFSTGFRYEQFLFQLCVSGSKCLRCYFLSYIPSKAYFRMKYMCKDYSILEPFLLKSMSWCFMLTLLLARKFWYSDKPEQEAIFIADPVCKMRVCGEVPLKVGLLIVML